MAKVVEIEDLKQTDAFRKNGYVYPHPHDLITKVVDKIEEVYNDQVRLYCVVDAEGGARLPGGQEVITYGKGYFVTRISNFLQDNRFGLVPNIGLLWSYDGSKQFIKVFAGATVSACTNLCIWADEHIVTKSFTKPKGSTDLERKRNWERQCRDITEDVVYKVEDYMNEVENVLTKINESLHKLDSVIIKNDDIAKLMGAIYINEIVNGTFDYYLYSEASKLMFNEKHNHENSNLYAYSTTFDDQDVPSTFTTLYKVYGALTQRITDLKVNVDLIPDKTIEVAKMLDRYADDLIDNSELLIL